LSAIVAINTAKYCHDDTRNATHEPLETAVHF